MTIPAELVTMNETFVKARGMFDRMMEESLARHSGCESACVSLWRKVS